MDDNCSIDFDPYELLDLKPDCTDAQIVKAFRKAALKWHPDKNPNRKKQVLAVSFRQAQEMFLKISKAFELLSDLAARAAYDHVLATRTAHSIYIQRRQKNENEKRRKLREELEKREANVLNVQHDEEKARKELEKEIERLRKEELLARYKLRWEERENGRCNYDEDNFRELFSKYGHVSDIIVSSGNKGMAILEFDELLDVDGVEKEIGKPDIPITVTCLLKPPAAMRNLAFEIQPNRPKERPMTSVEFANFEAEVLMTMMAGSKRKADDGKSKFDNL
ncbi:DnaJ-like protein subfamily C member 17 [Dirofilaria immitis]|nr:DnaJ-like protein subfamily C member 17 [Dirofilaria immitis]